MSFFFHTDHLGQALIDSPRLNLNLPPCRVTLYFKVPLLLENDSTLASQPARPLLSHTAASPSAPPSSAFSNKSRLLVKLCLVFHLSEITHIVAPHLVCVLVFVTIVPAGPPSLGSPPV